MLTSAVKRAAATSRSPTKKGPRFEKVQNEDDSDASFYQFQDESEEEITKHEGDEPPKEVKEQDTEDDKKREAEEKRKLVKSMQSDILDVKISDDVNVDDKDKKLEEDEENYTVYPLCVEYTWKEKCCMRLQRIFYLLVLVLILLPYDVLVPNKYFRWYWASKQTELKFSLGGVSLMEMDLQGCSMLLRGASSKDTVTAKITTGYGVNPSLQGSKIKVHNSDDSEKQAVKCLIQLYLPTKDTAAVLPSIKIKTAGQENTKIKIYEDLGGKILNFGSNSFTVTGALMNIYLNGAHEMGSVVVSLEKGHIQMKKLNPSVSASIVVDGGVMDLHTQSDVVTLTNVVETHGQICIKGGHVTSTPTNCPNAATIATDIPYNNGIVDTSSQCTVTGSLCKNSTCSGTPTFALTAKAKDGSVQISNGGTTSTVSYLRSKVQINIQSQQIIKKFAKQMENNPDEDYLLIMDVFMPGYTGVWMYTTKKSYIIGVPWALSAVSASLLTSNQIRVKLYLTDSSCMTRDRSSVEFLTALATQIQSYLTDSISTLLVHHKTLDAYYQYQINEKGQAEETLINISSVDGTFIAAYTISGFIAIYGAIQMMVILYKLFKVANIQYTEYLDKQRHYALVKKYHDSIKKSKGQKKKKKKKEGLTNVKTFHLGLFSHTIKNAKEEASKSVHNKIDLSRYGFFTIISIVYEKQRRKNINSLIKFLELIPESPSHFPQNTFQKHSGQYKTSIKVNLFESKYQEFCIKYGYTPMILDEHKPTLEAYGIQVVHKMDKKTLAYTKLRWKRDHELSEKIEIDKEVLEADNPINLFLKEKCVATHFQSDYIFAKDLKKSFRAYCQEHEIPSFKQESIVGSEEVDKFGAVLDQNFAIRVIENITDAKSEPTMKDFDCSFVRGSISETNKASKLTKIKNKLRNLVAQLWGVAGPATCFLQVLVNYIAILLIVVPMYIIVHFIYGEKSQFSDDVYSTYFDIEKIVQPDKSYHYPTMLSAYGAALAITIYCIFVYIVALIELVSYLQVGFLNTGRYAVKRSILKNIVTVTFWCLFFINLFLYIAYILMVLVWFVLGAIINPNKFLPYATASITFITFIYTNKNRLQKFYDDLVHQLSEIVKKKMLFFLKKTLEQLAGVDSGNDITKQLANQVEKSTKEVFVKQILGSLGKNISEIDKELLPRLLEGDQEAYETLISTAIGLHESLIKIIFALYKNDRKSVIKALEALSIEIKIDPELTNGVLSIFYQETENVKERFGGKILVGIKKVVRYFFPDFDLDILDILIPLMSDFKIDKLVDLLETLANSRGIDFSKSPIPTRLFSVIRSFMNNYSNNYELSYMIDGLFQGDEMQELKSALRSIMDMCLGDYQYALQNITKQLGYEHLKFILELVVALAKKDKYYLKGYVESIHLNLIKLCAGQLKPKEEEEKDAQFDDEPVEEMKIESEEKFQDLLKGVFNIFSGGRVDIQQRVKEYSWVDLSFFTHIDKAQNGQISDFEMVLDKMKLNQNREILLDFYSYFIHHNNQFIYINKYLEIEDKHRDLITLVKDLIELSLRMSEAIGNGEERYFWEYMNLQTRLKEFGTESQKSKKQKEGNNDYELFDKEREEVNKKDKQVSEVFRDRIKAKIIELGYGEKMYGHLQALSIILIANTKEDPNEDFQTAYENSLKYISKLFKIDKEPIELILDMCRPDPKHILKVTEYKPDADYWSQIKFESNRLAYLVKITGQHEYYIRDFARYWYSKFIEIKKANEQMKVIGENVLQVSPKFIEFMLKKKIELDDTDIELDKYQSIEKMAQIITIVYEFTSEQIDDCPGTKLIQTKSNEMLTKILDDNFPMEKSLTPACFNGIVMDDKEKVDYLNRFIFYMFELVAGIFIQYGATFPELSLRKEQFILFSLQRYILQRDSYHLIDMIRHIAEYMHPDEVDQEKRNLLIQVCLFMVCGSFNEDINQNKMVEALNNVLALNKTTKKLKKGQVQKPTSLSVFQIQKMKKRHILAVLFEDGFFKDVAELLFKTNLRKQFKIEHKVSPESLLGAFMASVIDDSQMYNTCIIDIYKSIFPAKVIKGIIGLVQRDMNYESEIKYVAKKAGVDSKLLLKTLDLTSSAPLELTKDIEHIQPNSYENLERVGAYFRFIRKDLNYLRLISQDLKVDHKLLQCVFSLSLKDLKIAKPFIPQLSEKLQLYNFDSSLESLIKISAGDYKNIGIQVSEDDVLSAFLYFIQYSKKVKKTNTDTELERLINQEKANVRNFTTVLLRKLSQNININFGHKFRFGQISFTKWLKILQEQSWDESAVYMFQEFEQKIKDPKSIWNDDEVDYRMKKRVCQQRLKDLGTKNLIARVMIHQDQGKGVQKYKSDHEGKVCEIVDKFEKDGKSESDGVDALNKVGCTLKYSGFSGFEQDAFTCLDCLKNKNASKVICSICAYVCHEGHKIQRYNFGIRQKVKCQCSQIPDLDVAATQINMADDDIQHMCRFRVEAPDLDKIVKEEQLRKDEEAKKMEKNKKDGDEGGDQEEESYEEIQFKKLLYKYPVEQFIQDLNKTFPIPKEMINKDLDQSYLRDTGMDVFDYQTSDPISFYENWIQLMHGNIRPSFITLFLGDEPYQEATNNEANFTDNFKSNTLKDFELIASIVSLAQGNMAGIEQYGSKMIKQLGIPDTSEESAIDFINMIYLLINGSDDLKWEDRNLIERLFKKIFDEQTDKVMELHQLLTMPNKILLQALDYKEENKSNQNDDEQKLIKNVSEIFKQFNQRVVNHQAKTEQSFVNLLKFGLGDKQALSKCHFNIEQIIEDATSDIKHDRIPVDYFVYLQEGSEYTKVLVVNKYLQSLIDKDDCYKINSYTYGILSMLNLNTYALDEVFQGEVVLSKCVSFLTGMLKQDSSTMFDMFLAYKGEKELKKMSGEQVKVFKDDNKVKKKRIRTLLNLMQDKWDGKDIEYLILMIKESDVYTPMLKDDANRMTWINHPDTPYIFADVIKVLHGDFTKAGKLMDEMFNKNKSCIYTLLFNLFTGNSWQDILESQIDTLGDYKTLVKREVYKVMISLMAQSKYMKVGKVESKVTVTLGNEEEEEKEGGESYNESSRVHDDSEGSLIQSPENMSGAAAEKEIKPLIGHLSQVSVDGKIVDLNMKSLEDMMGRLSEFHIPEIFTMCLSLDSNMMNEVFNPSIILDLPHMKIAKELYELYRSGIKTDSIIALIDTFKLDHKITLKYFPDFFNLDLSEIEDVLNDIKIDYEGQLPSALKTTLEYKLTETGIEMSVVKLIELVIQNYENEKHMFRLMIRIFQPLFKNIPFIPQLINALLDVIDKYQWTLFKYIPTIVMMGMVVINFIKHMAKEQDNKDKLERNKVEPKEGEGEGEEVVEAEKPKLKLVTKKDVLLSKAMINFLKLVIYDVDKQYIDDLLRYVIEYAELSGANKNILQFKDKLPLLSTAIYGVCMLAKKNFWNISSFAQLLGDFDSGKFQSLQNKILKFSQIFKKGQASVDKDKVQDMVKGMMNDLMDEAFDVSELFAIFDKDGNGMIEYAEFRDVDKYLGFNLGEQKMLQLFSKADKDQDNYINYDEFVEAQLLIRYHVAVQSLEKVGLSLFDLVYFFIQSLIILMLLLCFIFVGIIAMSTQGSFTSIVNSLMPIAAGLGVSSRKFNIEETVKKLKDVVDKVLEQMRNAV